MNAIWTILWINAATGMLLTCALLLFRRRFSLSRWLDGVMPDSEPDACVSVIIAARNEAASIEKTLTQLSAMPEVREILVVDDASDDETLNIIQRVASCEPRVRAYSAPPLPSGWIGKSHAIHWVSQHATGEYLLFTDADIDFHDLPLGAIVKRMQLDGIDHVGGMFRFRSRSAIEKILGACYSVVSFLGLAIAARAGSGAATGAFNLLARNTYMALGGHQSIKGCIMDDVALARSVTESGHTSQFLDMSPCLSVHLFSGVRGFDRSVSRLSVSFLPGKHSAFISMLLGLFVIGYMSISAFIPFTQPESPLSPWWVAVFTYCCFSLPFHFGQSLRDSTASWSWGAPLALLLMGVIVVRSGVACLRGKRISWRNREYIHCSTRFDVTGEERL